MNQSDKPTLRIHEDPAFLREAVNYTAAETGFLARLVEKDYFATLFLSHLAGHDGANLVFKGGTCLAKIHSEFYRLSEDLDFVIPVNDGATRNDRRLLVEDAKSFYSNLSESSAGIYRAKKLQGANQSKQFLGAVGYRSVLDGREQTIKVEISLREPLLCPVEDAQALTILISPASERQMVPPVPVRCISLKEAMAEKFRAALTRRIAAIRDFYDIGHAVSHLGLDIDDPDFVELVKSKLAVPGNDPINLDPRRFDNLRSEMNETLRPVIRSDDLPSFDFEFAIGLAKQMAEKVS